VKSERIQIGRFEYKIPKSRFAYELRNEKEPFVLDWLEDNVSQNGVFFDVGANVGEYSLYASSLMNSTLQIYSFEPREISRNHMLATLKLNKIQNVNLLPFALSDIDGRSFLRQSSIKNPFYGKSRIQNKNNSIKIRKDMKNNMFKKIRKIDELVQLRSVDSLIESRMVSPPNLIKIDVEGHELQVIKGMADLLSSKYPTTILLEVEKRNFDELQYIMSEFGYTKVEVYRDFVSNSPGYFSFSLTN
jgi:FkbM family methyltransferase